MSKSNQKDTKRGNGKEKEKIPVTFNRQQLDLIDENAGMLGNTRAEIVRNIVINWLLQNKDRCKKEQK